MKNVTGGVGLIGKWGKESCDPIGTENRIDSQCICKEGFSGLQCENCAAKHIRNEEKICISKYILKFNYAPKNVHWLKY